MPTYQRRIPLYQAKEYERGQNEQDILDWISGLPHLEGPRDPADYFTLGDQNQLLRSGYDFSDDPTIPTWTIVVNLHRGPTMNDGLDTHPGPISDWTKNFTPVTTTGDGLHIA